jgi:ATP-dependent phosphofructokinase / diphosphate-dependent phosphofructokinase
MSQNNAFYAQSGGVTAVINATACGVIEAARNHPDQLGKVFAGRYGILGALQEELIDTSLESASAIAALRYTPGGAFGSCRYKLKGLNENRAEYTRLLDVFAAHGIRYFFYNGGGDSQDTTHKVAQLAQQLNYPLTCIGLPKTIDNDLPLTDNSPGFGSVAKYIATSTREAALDVASMAKTSTKVFILEVMGRHTGWIAASAGLAKTQQHSAPHIILFPERPFIVQEFIAKVQHCVTTYGFCVIVASEGIKYPDGTFVAQANSKDAFGHAQLGGTAPVLAAHIKQQLDYKYHWALADYLQRSARHIASKTDVEQAYALGRAAIAYALAGHSNIMLTIERQAGSDYRWAIGHAPLAQVANREKALPNEFIDAEGFGITAQAREYLLPLIQGEDYPPFVDGLPNYVKLNNQLVAKKLENAFS